MMNYAIDLWSLVHLLGWGLGGSILARRRGVTGAEAAFLGLVVGLAWELVEKALVEPWLGFHEPPWNRWFFDLLADGVGAGLGAYSASLNRLFSRKP